MPKRELTVTFPRIDKKQRDLVADYIATVERFEMRIIGGLRISTIIYDDKKDEKDGSPVE